MRIIYLSCLYALSWIWSPAADAGWVEARSENFLFKGDVKQSQAEKLVRNLEFYRRNVFQALGASGQPELTPIRIYAVKSKKQIKAILGTDNFGGMYQTTLRGPAFLLNAKSGFNRNNRAAHIAYHEYVHHLIALNTKDQYPRWFNEGYAEYLATYKYKDDKFTIGAPDDSHAYPLQRLSWMPMDVILGSVRNYPFDRNKRGRADRRERALFYAQSWLAVHYILSHKEMGKKMQAYVKALPGSHDPLKTFEDSFGMDAKAFESKLRAYLKANKFPVGTYAAKTVEDVVVTSRALSKIDGAYYMADVARHFSGSKAGRDRAIALYDKIPEGSDYAADIWAGRADIAARANDFEAAQNYIGKAKTLAADKDEVVRTSGEILMLQYSETRKTQDLIDAKDLFAQLITKNAHDPSASYHFASACGPVNCDIRKAVKAANLARQYYRDAQFAGSNLNLASVYLKARDYQSARDIAEFAFQWGYTPEIRIGARQLSNHLKNK